MALLLTIKTYIMTTEEIKNLIDQKIAGQGTMVDVGGALPTILKEIVDMASQGGGSDIKPIMLTALPEEGMSLDDLATIGLTKDEIIAAANGERNGVVITTQNGPEYYTITDANYTPKDPDSLGSTETVKIIFLSFTFRYNESADIQKPRIDGGYEVTIEDNVPTITEGG